MGALWLLLVAIICHSAHVSTAWPDNKTQELKKPEDLTSNNSSPTELSRTNVTSSVQIKNSSSQENTLREKRGTLLQDNNFEKRGQKQKFSSWAGKRSESPDEDKRARFSSWGGKRSDEDILNNIYENLNNLKRAKFSSWGGKRDNIDDASDKRAKFSSWAGKRDIPDETIEEKRTKFNSWAGKRTVDSLNDKRAKFSSWAGKRGKFNSWAGKRSELDHYPEVPGGTIAWNENPENELNGDYFAEDKRAKFSSWAGKRSPDYIGNSWHKLTPSNHQNLYTNGMGEKGSENIMKLWQDLMSRKRARFSSWAGKRSDETIADIESLDRLLSSQEEEKRGAKFSSWAGKRDDTENDSDFYNKQDESELLGDQAEDSMIVKRSIFSWGSPSVAYKRKPIFSSWGGKRSDPHNIQVRSVPVKRPLVFMNGAKSRPWATLSRPIRKQPEFYAWGGKRSTDYTS